MPLSPPQLRLPTDPLPPFASDSQWGHASDDEEVDRSIGLRFGKESAFYSGQGIFLIDSHALNSRLRSPSSPISFIHILPLTTTLPAFKQVTSYHTRKPSHSFIMSFNKVLFLPLLAGLCSASPHLKRTTYSDVVMYAYGTNISGLPILMGNNDGEHSTNVLFSNRFKHSSF